MRQGRLYLNAREFRGKSSVVGIGRREKRGDSSMSLETTTLVLNDNDAVLAKIIGSRITIEQTAAALRCTPKSVYNLIDRHKIPFIKILDKRFIEPADIRTAVLKDQQNAPARGRGRPRKNAA